MHKQQQLLFTVEELASMTKSFSLLTYKPTTKAELNRIVAIYLDKK